MDASPRGCPESIDRRLGRLLGVISSAAFRLDDDVEELLTRVDLGPCALLPSPFVLVADRPVERARAPSSVLSRRGGRCGRAIGRGRHDRGRRV